MGVRAVKCTYVVCCLKDFATNRVMGFVHMQVYRKLGRGPLAGGNWEGSRYGITLLIFHSCLNEVYYSKGFFFLCI
jgi:hypothetical protein